jgi:hypothetical protein
MISRVPVPKIEPEFARHDFHQMHDRLVNMGLDEVEAAKYVQPEE